MKNPYHDRLQGDDVCLGRIAAVVWSSVFFLLVVSPWVVSPLFPDKALPRPAAAGLELSAWLRKSEKSVESMALFEAWREADQARLIHHLGTGNRKVVIGRNGWLYYRPDLEAIFGKGPAYREPPSVAREAVKDTWHPAVEIIKAFNSQLVDRKIELILVPVPTKPMLCPSGLGREGTVAHPEWDSILGELRESGIRVVDLMAVFADIPAESDRYLKQDTHWTPIAMKRTAQSVATLVGREGAGAWIAHPTPIERTHFGDLVEMLGVPEPERLFQPERETLLTAEDSDWEDSESDIVLLGDSFVNIFDDPTLGFGEEESGSIDAGFGAHLALEVGRPVHVIASNGGGATAVRRSFAGLGSNAIARKSVVIWVFSSRDLLLAEIPGRRAGISWEPVELPATGETHPEQVFAPLVVEATLRERSFVGDPRETPYHAAIYSALFEEIAVLEGRYEGEEMYAFLWAFRERVISDSESLEPGQRYRLELAPLERSSEASRAAQIDDFFRTDLNPYFVNKVSLVP